MTGLTKLAEQKILQLLCNGTLCSLVGLPFPDCIYRMCCYRFGHVYIVNISRVPKEDLKHLFDSFLSALHLMPPSGLGSNW